MRGQSQAEGDLGASIVVTNTMISEASRYLSGPDFGLRESRGDRISRFFDFCSLVEVLMLYQHLQTLSGYEIGSITPWYPLQSELRDRGILNEGAVYVDGKRAAEYLAPLIGNRWIGPDEMPFSTRHDSRWNRDFFLASVENANVETSLNGPRDVVDFLSSDAFGHFIKLGYSPNEAYDVGEYIARGLLYAVVCCDRGLPLFPDYARIPFIRSLSQTLTESLVAKAYTLFAKRLGSQAEDFLQTTRQFGVPIPPFCALLLSRCTTAGEVMPRLFEMREEYTELRTRLATLERRRQDCGTIGQMLEYRRRVQAIFEAATRKLDRKGYTVFQNSLAYLEKLASPLSDPWKSRVLLCRVAIAACRELARMVAPAAV